MTTLDPRIYCQLPELLALQHKTRHLSLKPSYRPAGMLAGQHASKIRGSGLNFEELRQYQQGDNVRLIDSRASARLGKPYVRVYSEETDRPVYLVVDQRSSMFFGSVKKTKSVVAAELAASLAWMILANGDRFGGIVVGAQQSEHISARRSQQQVLHFLSNLVAANQGLTVEPAQADSSESLLAPLLPWLSSLNNQAVVMLITDIDGLDQQDISQLEWLHQQTNVALFIVADALEQNLSQAQGLTISQGKQQVNLAIDAQSQASFNQQFQAKFKQIQHALGQSVLPIGLLDCEQDIVTQLNLLLGGQYG
ncbi:DUF58 domain-containing protein [Motilimonas pumila]|uniref:DUF58 domain-containing protein n=1 Tax=Motilimonas pumila TaxID=2303987 RepID=A0A418YHQ8_9GAMM|nr:DUF58 domain-containing protein [Motilimonas pumila]RJG49913.1 DUF58 domain-containing protein [Motilimonas pumila]